jgi:hypothetical protein
MPSAKDATDSNGEYASDKDSTDISSCSRNATDVQLTTIVFKGLQKPLPVRGGKLDTSDVILEFPFDTPLAELGNHLQSHGKSSRKK